MWTVIHWQRFMVFFLLFVLELCMSPCYLYISPISQYQLAFNHHGKCQETHCSCNGKNRMLYNFDHSSLLKIGIINTLTNVIEWCYRLLHIYQHLKDCWLISALDLIRRELIKELCTVDLLYILYICVTSWKLLKNPVCELHFWSFKLVFVCTAWWLWYF